MMTVDVFPKHDGVQFHGTYSSYHLRLDLMVIDSSASVSASLIGVNRTNL
jgi:hypothetical protein